MTLPGWLTPLPDAAGQREIDRWAMEDQGADWLMRRAGAGLARVAAELAPDGRIVVLCGKGNNGGDGLVAATRLREAGREVDVYLAAAELSGEPAAWLASLPGAAPKPLERLIEGSPGDRECSSPRHEGTSAVTLVIDALLGTGFSGAPRAPLDAVIEAVNASGVPVLAADVPSGVDASTGEVEGPAIRATATVTFHAAKPGLGIHPGKAHAGTVHPVHIGVPPGGPQTATAGLLGPAVLDDLPRRGPDGSKFTSGAVVVLGGSRGLTGAPIMAAHAAMRAGAGYVTLAGAQANEAAFAARPVEVMLTLLPDEDGGLGAEAIDPAAAACDRAGAVVLGPGLGRGDGAQAFVDAILAGVDAPIVLDADGLNALQGRFPAGLPDRARPAGPTRTVLTPHEAELARLLGTDPDDVAAHRLAHVRDAAARTGAVVVLKGDDTLIAHPDGRVAVSPGGAPGLATAGTGDVLSGVTAAVLARGLDPWHAACAAVWLHLEAGKRAAQPHGPDAMIASDVISALPAALG